MSWCVMKHRVTFTSCLVELTQILIHTDALINDVLCGTFSLLCEMFCHQVQVLSCYSF